jgi:hypothetical protein
MSSFTAANTEVLREGLGLKEQPGTQHITQEGRI